LFIFVALKHHIEFCWRRIACKRRKKDEHWKSGVRCKNDSLK